MTRTTEQKHQQRLRIVVRDGDCCHWCRARFDALRPATLEHLVPRCYGGTHDDSNVVLACAPCNNSRRHYVRCARCGHRVRSFSRVVWVDRRLVLHADCARPYVTVPAQPGDSSRDVVRGSGVPSARG